MKESTLACSVSAAILAATEAATAISAAAYFAVTSLAAAIEALIST